MRLIDNWQQSWRWLSMQAAAAVATLNTIWIGVPADIRQPWMGHAVEVATVLLSAAAMFGRLINQTPTEPSK